MLSPMTAFATSFLMVSLVFISVEASVVEEYTVNLLGNNIMDSLTPKSLRNLRQDCDAWAMENKCSLNADFMKVHCPVSCGITSQNLTATVKLAREFGFGHRPAKFSPNILVDVGGGNIGVPQEMSQQKLPIETRQAMFDRIREAQDYIRDTVMGDDFYRPVRDLCRNQDERCALWATMGECEANPDFMYKNCAPVCFQCEYLHTATRCPIDPNMKNAWYPGDLNRMFERIVDVNEANYDITTLSRPKSDNATATLSKNKDHEPLDGPWIITIDNFISEEEAQTLIGLGAKRGYQKSTDSGAVQEDGSFGEEVSKERTSTNAWCQEECLKHNVTRAVVSRIEELIRIPEVNAESFQMLRYEPGQFYGVHHDYIHGQQHKAEGARILTVFLYLNDVEEGGATNFSELDLAVFPKRGRVLIWPSVLDEDPHAIDLRTKHEAQKVIKGIKYGANAWYHVRNNQIPMDMGCV